MTKFNEDYMNNKIARYREAKKDWAFLDLASKLTSRQLSFLFALADRDGTCGRAGVGIDYGGASAYQTIVTGLVRKGLIKPRTEGGYSLVEGEPASFTEAVLPKPFIKVRRQLMHLYDGEAIRETNQFIWLDPRGDAEFHVILHPEIVELCKGASGLRTQPGELYTASGKTLEECVKRAESLCREFMELKEGIMEDVLLIYYNYSTPDLDEQTKYTKTGLNFSYLKLVRSSSGRIYERLEDGRLTLYSHSDPSMRNRDGGESAVMIPYSPEAHAGLESVRQRLALMAHEFARIIHEENFVEMLTAGGAQILLGHES